METSALPFIISGASLLLTFYKHFIDDREKHAQMRTDIERNKAEMKGELELVKSQITSNNRLNDQSLSYIKEMVERIEERIK